MRGNVTEEIQIRKKRIAAMEMEQKNLIIEFRQICKRAPTNNLAVLQRRIARLLVVFDLLLILDEEKYRIKVGVMRTKKDVGVRGGYEKKMIMERIKNIT